jgi:hypothetical protein
VLVKPGAIKVASLTCGSTACAIKAPKSVKIKVKRKRYRVNVLVPKALRAGASGKLRVTLPKAARKALTGRRTTVKVKVEITAGTSKTTKTIKATLKGREVQRDG